VVPLWLRVLDPRCGALTLLPPTALHVVPWYPLQELRDPEGGNWQVEGVPHQLIHSMSSKIKGAPVELPPLDLPQAAAGAANSNRQPGR